MQEVEINIDGWWVVWDKTPQAGSGQPFPQAVFRYEDDAKGYVKAEPIPNKYEIKKVAKK